MRKWLRQNEQQKASKMLKQEMLEMIPRQEDFMIVTGSTSSKRGVFKSMDLKTTFL